jgi:membrane protein
MREGTGSQPANQSGNSVREAMFKRTRSAPPSARRASPAPDSSNPEGTDSAKPESHPQDAAREGGHGRDAEKPTEVPKAGWLDVLTRTKQQISEDNLPIVGAGVAFYAFVAVVPALVVFIALYGLIADPATVSQHISSLAETVPGEVMPLLEEQMNRIASTPQSASVSAIIGLIIALYGSAKATKALIKGLNIAYDENEKRGFLKLNAIALVLTIGAMISAIIAIALVAVLPAIVSNLNLGETVEKLVVWLRWPVLIGGFTAVLAVVYRFGPSRNDPKWRWVSPGAIVAGLLWLLGSAAFSLYVSQFGNYDKTYGPLGAIVVFLLWLLISALAILVGAEVNAELERQTLKDSTRGESKPIGTRGAEAADTVGPTREEMPAKKKT